MPPFGFAATERAALAARSNATAHDVGGGPACVIDAAYQRHHTPCGHGRTGRI